MDIVEEQVRKQEPAPKQAADPEAHADKELSDEERFAENYAKSTKAIFKESAQREIYYKTLLLVRGQSDEKALHDAILAFPEMKVHLRSPRFYLDKLADTGALVRVPVEDEQGASQEGTQEDGLASAEDAQAQQVAEGDDSDKNIVSAPVECTWTLSPVGEQLIADLSPANRLSTLYDAGGKDVAVFTLLLDYCSTPRTRPDIEARLSEDNILQESGLAASYFLDKLEQCGGLVWNDGWIATGEGRRFLETMKAQQSD